MNWRQSVVCVVALAAAVEATVLAPAQDSAKFKVDVNVVHILATVRDRAGHIAPNLSKDDFILEEDGRRQEIEYFSRQSDLPLTLGLLVDTSMSQRRLIENERKASVQFLNQVLRPEDDQAFVIKFDVEVELLQDLTHSRPALQDALAGLAVPSTNRRPTTAGAPSKRPFRFNPQGWPGGQRPPIGGQRRPGPGGRGGRGMGGGIGTLLFDSVFLAADEVLSRKEGRKAVILISDGVDAGSSVSQKDAIAAAHRAEMLIYSIRYFDTEAYLGGGGRGGRGGGQASSRGEEVLASLSRETGGRMFEVSKKLSLTAIFDQIQEELRNQYSLGYTPSDLGRSDFRRIQLRTTDDKLEVVTRAGYYPRLRP